MAFDFPNSPTDGTSFSPAGGPTYIYSGGVWKISGGGGAFVVVSDAAPPSPYPGMLWFESDTGALFFWYVDADSAQWVQINFTPSGARTAGTRNRIVNPAMQISQELGTTGTGTAAAYIVDQWNAQVSGISFSASKTTATTHQIGITVLTGKALAAGDFFGFTQPIEGIRLWDFGYGTAAALSSVLQFEVYCTITGTFGVALKNGAANRTLVLPFTITAANAWQTITLAIPGDTTGTWVVDNTVSMYLSVMFAVGATYATTGTGWQAGTFLGPTGMTNGALTTNNAFYFRNVGLYLDPDATGIPPKWVMPDEAQELAACQRYFAPTQIEFSGNVTSAAAYSARTPLPVAMRIVPAWSGANTANTAFPATPGTLAGTTAFAAETRVANGSGTARFLTTVTANARM